MPHAAWIYMQDCSVVSCVFVFITCFHLFALICSNVSPLCVRACVRARTRLYSAHALFSACIYNNVLVSAWCDIRVVLILIVSPLDGFTSWWLHLLMGSPLGGFTSWWFHLLMVLPLDGFTSWWFHLLVVSPLDGFTSWWFHSKIYIYICMEPHNVT